MRRSLVLTGTFAGVLILMVLFLVMRERSAQPARQFQVKDTEKIRRIVFRRDSITLELRRKKDAWWVDDRWKVRDRAIRVLMKVLQETEVKSPLSDDRVERIREDTAGMHIQVKVSGVLGTLKKFEVYVNEKIPGGNMMRLQGKKKWFITWLPGEDVNPAALFVTDPYYWRDLTLFRYLPGEVVKAEIHYGNDRKKGFVAGIDTLTGNVFFQPFDTIPEALSVDTQKVRKYLTYFQQLSCDAYDRSLTPAQKDSLLQIIPMYDLRITARDGRVSRLRVYPLPARDTLPGAGSVDPDLARAWTDPVGEMVLIKYYRIDPFLLKANDLLQKGR